MVNTIMRNPERIEEENNVPPPYRKSLCFWCEAGTAGVGAGCKELSLGLRSGFSPPPPL